MPLRLNRAQVREIDRRSIEQFHIPGIVLMENAARSFVQWFSTQFREPDLQVTIVCGNGSNGGDGYAIARHLHNRGISVDIIEGSDAELHGDALTNSNITAAMGINTVCMEDAEDYLHRYSADIVIDALFGTGLSRPIEGDAALLVELMNNSQIPVVAVDLPSGLNCDTGEVMGSCVRALHTFTLVAEKAGFSNPNALEFIGEVIVGDIGCPRELIEEVSKLSL